jgi:WD40 repeat protein
MRTLLIILLAALPSIAAAQQLETVIQKGHELAVLGVAVSSDSNHVATTSLDKSAKLWEISTGREVRSFLGHEMGVTCVTFSADGKVLLTGSNDKSIRLWDVTTGKALFTHRAIDYITDVEIDPHQRFFVYAGYNTTGYGDSAVIFDFKSKEILSKLPISPDKGLHTGADVAISHDGKLLAFGEDNRVATVFETGTWKQVMQFTYHEGFCGSCGTRVAFSPDDKSLYIASHNGPVKKCDLLTGHIQKTYADKVEDLTGLSLSNDGKKLAVATEKGAITYDTEKGVKIGELSAPEKGEFHHVAFGLDNRSLIIASDNNTAITWDVTSTMFKSSFTGFLNTRDKGGLNYDPNFYWESYIAKYVRFKNNLMISNDGKSLIKGKFGTRVKRWDIASGKAVMEYTGHKKAVLCYDLSRDGSRMLTGGGDGKIMLWDVATGDSLQVIQSYREPIFDIQFNTDETKVVTSSWDASMHVHDLSTGKSLSFINFESYSAYTLLFHPSDLYVFTGRLDNTLQMWELDTRTVVRTFVGHTDVISSLTMTQDQRTLLSTGWDGTIRLWDIGTGLMTKRLAHPSGAVHTAVFSADEKYVYSAGADRLIRVWDIASGKVVRTFAGHNAEVTSLLFSPDRRMLISHSLDGVTKFWELSSGREFFEHIHLGDHDWLVKNPDGYFTGTDQARRFIHFVSGNTTYSVDQFFHEFYRPDLLPKFFQSRGSIDEGKGIPGKLKNSPPPTVKIALLPHAGNKAEVMVRMTDNGAGVQNLRILHNGKSMALNRSALSYPEGKDQYVTYKHEVDLIGGTNTFSAVATNRDNVESDSRSVDFFTESESKHSVCYILAVGINEYKNPKLNLNYAKPDAESFGKIVNEQSSALFNKVELVTLYDKDATRQRILNELDRMAGQVHQEDVFVLYYAGHGSMVDNKFYFIPTENSRLYDASTLQKEGIEAAIIQEKLRNIRALKQLIVMDACQSGGSVELLATRGATEEKAIAQLSRSTGIHVMASAGSEQFATEFTELGHGLFTYVLIKALEGAADGAPKDGKVTIYELKSFIDDQVPEMTRKLKGKPQYPYTFSRGQDFPVVIKTE